jgi:anti-sigma28 factor (negative regulator of flagellin synthesis)
MKIGPVDSGDRPHRPDDREIRKPDPNQSEPRSANQTDKVEISSTARSLSKQKSQPPEESGETPAAERSEDADEAPEMENRADKIEQARQRIESGHYDSASVKEEIARRITDDFVG